MAAIVPKPVFRLWMQGAESGRDANIAPLVTSCAYTDRAHGESDELALEIDDFKGELFKGEWMPKKGQGLSLSIGYDQGHMLDCGRFVIDEFEFRGPPDVLTIRALNADIKKALRTDEYEEYEEVTLLEVVEQVARSHGYGVIGAGTGGMEDIVLQRVSQDKEDDLAFLKRLAAPYGYVFKVTANNLVFHAVRALEQQRAYVTLDRKDVGDFTLTNSTRKMYHTCEVRYHDPKTGRLIVGNAYDDSVVKGDTLKLKVRCENEAQARVMANESLRAANAKEITGNIRMRGHPGLVSGYVFNLTGMLMLSGRYLIETSTHTLNRNGGYSTRLNVRKVR